MQIEVTRDVIEAMRLAARDALPREACGILLGDGLRIVVFEEARNVHSSPKTHFEIDPQALIDAHRAARGGGAKVVGYFHSHPNGAPKPSATDEAMAAGDGLIWAIAAADDLKFYRSGKAGFEALSMQIIDG
ncbi:Mov34/MPN/PAD-1 family protein [Erythrobacter rubeus]|uniref:M67 family metallopeptidase n=1 Tax=Erythrobacter rubeus TaxID=2760803 RepID=A0ABR8KT89_9SPHN|nr:M67 family metallopeptidase [Erythrobacter rubeus]MBD2842647.1 M67 family metallopeptidase [Erythrobacter rubeus]